MLMADELSVCNYIVCTIYYTVPIPIANFLDSLVKGSINKIQNPVKFSHYVIKVSYVDIKLIYLLSSIFIYNLINIRSHHVDEPLQ